MNLACRLLTKEGAAQRRRTVYHRPTSKQRPAHKHTSYLCNAAQNGLTSLHLCRQTTDGIQQLSTPGGGGVAPEALQLLLHAAPRRLGGGSGLLFKEAQLGRQGVLRLRLLLRCIAGLWKSPGS